MTAYASLAAFRWSPSTRTTLDPEASVADAELTGEAVVRVTAGGSELLFRDELLAVLVHLAARGPVACLSRGEPRYRWRLTATPSDAELAVDGDRVALRLDDQVLTAPSEELWPALIGVGVRYAERLSHVNEGLAQRFEDDLAPARALLAERGWRVPEPPSPVASEPVALRVPRFVRVDPWLRHPEAQAFYTAVLGSLDGVQVHPADGAEGPPQWFGTLDVDPAGREDWLDEGAIELDRDGDTSVWMDPWGATFFASESSEPGLQAVHRELFSLEPEEAVRFWALVFGADVAEHDGGWRLERGGSLVATVRATEGNDVARWIHYLPVTDLDAAVARATAAGAEVVEQGGGWARLVDPFGAEFGLGASG